MAPLQKRFRRVVGGMTVAETTVLSFLVASLIGGSVLWYTERDRMVEAHIAVQRPVFVELVQEDPSLSPPTRQEFHVFTKTVSYKGERFIDALFVAVSALTVTGLSSTDFSAFTLTGQIITLLLIQMGGLGIILFTSLFAMLFVRRLSKRQTFREVMSGILDSRDIERMAVQIVTYTLSIQGVSFLIIGTWLQWFANPGITGGNNPWWWALFHSVSAFNNAGFSLMPNNLMNFVYDPVVNLVLAAEIILGGLGYPVLIAVHIWMREHLVPKQDKRLLRLRKKLSEVMASPVQTRIALVGTILLLSIGTLIPLFFEHDNPLFLDATGSQQMLMAFFQSVATRTAGYNTIPIGSLSTATLFLYMILMYIGANPAGTGGGIKIPTVAVLYGYLKDWFRSPGEPIILFGAKIYRFALSHAVRLFFFSSVFIGFVTVLVTARENAFLLTPDPIFNFQKVIFEIISAFGTVGLSMGFPGGDVSFSAILHPVSKFLIITTMLFGRLGALTVLASLPWQRALSHHKEKILEGEPQKLQIG